MKYVIHHHITDPEHYDLMIEKDDALDTWRILKDDMQHLLEGAAVASEKISDHRKDYLLYEGPVSCGRGYVAIYDSGTCIAEESSYILKGTKLNGRLTLVSKSGSSFCEMKYHPEHPHG